MMYQNKLAIAVKSNGKVLREFKDTAFVPFGSEYSLLIKNLNSVRCRFSITIDGKDIADGDSFVINANSSIEIERFLRNGNMSAGNRFKFIERTAGVEAHRGGAQVEDGIIRVEFEFEREKVPVPDYYSVPTPIVTPWVAPVWPKPYWYGSPYLGSVNLNSSSAPVGGSSSNVSNLNDGHSADCSYTATANACSASVGSSIPDNYVKPDRSFEKSTVRSRTARGVVPQSTTERYSDFEGEMYRRVEVNEAGITAAGSISNQQFHTVSDINGDGVKHAMVIRLLGEVGQKKVTKPVTVSSKAKCTSCGRVNKATSKFCSECATSLEIV